VGIGIEVAYVEMEVLRMMMWKVMRMRGVSCPGK